MGKRDGKRKSREQINRGIIPRLGYYYIVTDTKETEYNYFNGLRDSIPEELRRNIVIKVEKTETNNLVSKAIEGGSLDAQYREQWIVFDRDKVEKFDKIINNAENYGVKTAWSNPCIEIWFSAYFGEMPTYQDSVKCCSGFSEKYYKTTNQKYIKSNNNIYPKLCEYGDEEQAIKIAESKYSEHKRKCNQKPSDMSPCTTVYKLVKEILGKINKENNT